MARTKATTQSEEVTPEVTSEVTVEAAPTIMINLDPVPEEEPPLSAQTLAEMEAGRASIARYQAK